jgi:antitoxin component of MazEF toxin-antitoxin module
VTKLIEVSHAKKRGASVGLIIPRKVLKKLRIEDEGIVGFYESEGRIYLKRME